MNCFLDTRERENCQEVLELSSPQAKTRGLILGRANYQSLPIKYVTLDERHSGDSTVLTRKPDAKT